MLVCKPNYRVYTDRFSLNRIRNRVKASVNGPLDFQLAFLPVRLILTPELIDDVLELDSYVHHLLGGAAFISL